MLCWVATLVMFVGIGPLMLAYVVRVELGWTARMEERLALLTGIEANEGDETARGGGRISGRAPGVSAATLGATTCVLDELMYMEDGTGGGGDGGEPSLGECKCGGKGGRMNG